MLKSLSITSIYSATAGFVIAKTSLKLTVQNEAKKNLSVAFSVLYNIFYSWRAISPPPPRHLPAKGKGADAPPPPPHQFWRPWINTNSAAETDPRLNVYNLIYHLSWDITFLDNDNDNSIFCWYDLFSACVIEFVPKIVIKDVVRSPWIDKESIYRVSKKKLMLFQSKISCEFHYGVFPWVYREEIVI